MISSEKQYEYATKRVNDLANAASAGLKIFLTSYSAVIGGSIALRTQIKGSVPPYYFLLSDVLVFLLTVVSITIVLENLRAWYGYREFVTRLTEDSEFPAPRPVLFPSAIIEFVLCAAMFLAGALFCLFNPFNH